VIAATFEESRAEVVVTPEHGRTVAFVVEWRLVDVGQYHRNRQWRYVVGLHGSDGQGFCHYLSFERACSKPRGLARVAS
jgi:hypothetical protein